MTENPLNQPRHPRLGFLQGRYAGRVFLAKVTIDVYPAGFHIILASTLPILKYYTKEMEFMVDVNAVLERAGVCLQ